MTVSSTRLVCCSLGPEAVLKQEVAEEDEARDEACATEAQEGSGQLVLDGSNAGLSWGSECDGLGPVELGRGADAGAVKLILKEGDPFHDLVKVALGVELASPLAESSSSGLIVGVDASLVGLESGA